MLSYYSLAQLFFETSIRTLTSEVTPPVLLKVFLKLKDYTPETPEHNSASHTLTLPILRHILLSHDSKAVSHELKESAAQVLNSAVTRYVTGAKDVSRYATSLLGLEMCLLQDEARRQLFPAVETLKLLSVVIGDREESIKVAKIKVHLLLTVM